MERSLIADAPESSPTPETALSADRGPERRRDGGLWSDDTTRLVLVAVTALPFVAAIVAYWGAPWFPVLDDAWLALRVRDVFSTDPPLVGPYSRLEINHPGPFMFVLLAPGQLLSGSAAWGLFPAVAVVNGAAAVGSVLVVLRVAGRVAGVLMALGVAVLVASVGFPELVSIWNPWFAALPFLFFVICCWGLAVGEDWYLVGAVVVGSFLIQTHLAYAPLVGTLVVVALTMVAFDTRRWWIAADATERRRRWSHVRRVGVVAFLLGVLVWVPPVLEQLTNEPGNLGETVEYFSEGSSDSVSLREAAGVTALEVGGRPPWAGGSEPTDVLGVVPGASLWRLLPVVVVSLVAALVAWRRVRVAAMAPRRLQLLVWSALSVGLLAVTRIDGVVQVHLVRWLWPLAMLAWVSAIWSLWTAATASPVMSQAEVETPSGGDREAVSPGGSAGISDVAGDLGGVARLVIVGLVGLAGIVSMATAVAAFDRVLPSAGWSDQTAAVVDVVDVFVDGGSVSVEVGDGRLASLAVASGLELALEARGAAVRVPPLSDVRYGDRLSWIEAPAELSLIVATGDGIGELDDNDELELVASTQGSASASASAAGIEPVAVFVRS